MDSRPQKLLVTADLHYGAYSSGDACTRQIAEYVNNSDADVFAIAGDVAGRDVADFRRCLGLFEGFPGVKLLVPGNHDVWTDGEDSEEKYRVLLPQEARRCGFRMLDTAPEVVGGVAFIGSMGWYDYSFRSPGLGLNAEQYAAKSLPGVATWNDGLFVHWSYSDAEFTDLCLRRLQEHYRQVEKLAESVVVILHHLPFRELLCGSAEPALEFSRAYMGSERFGELLLRSPAVCCVVCGHRHGPGECRRNSLDAFVVGSGYETKSLLTLDLRTAEWERLTLCPPEGAAGC